MVNLGDKVGQLAAAVVGRMDRLGLGELIIKPLCVFFGQQVFIVGNAGVEVELQGVSGFLGIFQRVVIEAFKKNFQNGGDNRFLFLKMVGQ